VEKGDQNDDDIESYLKESLKEIRDELLIEHRRRRKGER